MLALPPFAALAGLGRYDPASVAIFASFATPPAAARKGVIDRLVRALKAAGVWTELDALYLLAAADSQASLINWKAPAAYTAIAVNAPNFAVDLGWTGNGSTSRLRTQYQPSTDGVKYQQDDASLWSWSRSSGVVANQEVGVNTAPMARFTSRTSPDILSGRINDGGPSISASNADGAGWFGMQRRGATDRRAWKNGVQIGTDSQASTGRPSIQMWMCGANTGDFSTRQIAAAAFGASLSGLEASFYAAMLAYMQAVGAA